LGQPRSLAHQSFAELTGGESMTQTHAEEIYEKTKKSLLDEAGAPKQEKLTEWALLEIAEQLSAIRYELVKLNLPKPPLTRPKQKD
jgi:hypothetical protein